MNIKTYVGSIILFFMLLTTVYANFYEENHNNSEIYKQNIEKIENEMREIENYVKTYGIQGVFDKYQNFFCRSTYDWFSCSSFYNCDNFFGFYYSDIIKFEITECGRADENHKYLRCNIWRRGWTVWDMFFGEKGYANYVIYDKIDLLCDRSFGAVIAAYDTFKTHDVINDIKKLINNNEAKVYYRHWSGPGLFKSYWEYRKNLNSSEINLLNDYISNIKSGYSGGNKDDILVRMQHNAYPSIKLILNNNNVNYEIFLSYDVSTKGRQIYFKDHNFFTYFKYDNKLFFNIAIDFILMNNNKVYGLKPDLLMPDDKWGFAYSDYLFKSLPAESQEIMCKAKMEYIINELEDYQKQKNTILLLPDQKMFYKTLNLKNKMANYYKDVEEYMKIRWFLRERKYLSPECPSDHSKKYEYKIVPGLIELICPIHGIQTIRFK